MININEKSKKREYRSENNSKKVKKKDEKNNENNVPTEKQKTVYILGNSMIKELNGYLLTKKLDINSVSNLVHFQVLK